MLSWTLVVLLGNCLPLGLHRQLATHHEAHMGGITLGKGGRWQGAEGRLIGEVHMHIEENRTLHFEVFILLVSKHTASHVTVVLVLHPTYLGTLKPGNLLTTFSKLPTKIACRFPRNPPCGGACCHSSKNVPIAYTNCG